MNAPTLTTERLTLRAIGMADWERYAAMWNDPRVVAFIGSPRARDVAWAKFGQAVAMWTLFDYGNWAVIDRASDAFLGVCGLAQYERGIAELAGYPEAGWAFTADSWGRGIASEAVGAVVGWADAADLAETRCMIDNDNIASVKVAERNGFAAFADLSDSLRAFRRPSQAAKA